MQGRTNVPRHNPSAFRASLIFDPLILDHINFSTYCLKIRDTAELIPTSIVSKALNHVLARTYNPVTLFAILASETIILESAGIRSLTTVSR